MFPQLINRAALTAENINFFVFYYFETKAPKAVPFATKAGGEKSLPCPRGSDFSVAMATPDALRTAIVL